MVHSPDIRVSSSETFFLQGKQKLYDKQIIQGPASMAGYKNKKKPHRPVKPTKTQKRAHSSGHAIRKNKRRHQKPLFEINAEAWKHEQQRKTMAEAKQEWLHISFLLSSLFGILAMLMF